MGVVWVPPTQKIKTISNGSHQHLKRVFFCPNEQKSPNDDYDDDIHKISVFYLGTCYI